MKEKNKRNEEGRSARPEYRVFPPTRLESDVEDD